MLVYSILPCSSSSLSCPLVAKIPQCPACNSAQDAGCLLYFDVLLLKFSEDAWGSLDCYTVCLFAFLPNPIPSFLSDLVPLGSPDPLCLKGVMSHTPLLAGSAVLPVPGAALPPHF